MIVRALGLVLVIVFLLNYEPTSPDWINRLLLPGMALTGAFLIVRNITAVALAVAMLAGIASRPGADDWIVGLAYPITAFIALMVLALVLWRRFRIHVSETHASRWAPRTHDTAIDR